MSQHTKNPFARDQKLLRELADALDDVGNPPRDNGELRDTLDGPAVGGIQVGQRLRIINGEVYVNLPSRSGHTKYARVSTLLEYLQDLSARIKEWGQGVGP